MTTIVTKNGSGAPLASDLVQGELAVDLTNKRLYTEDSGGTVIEIGTSPSTIDINAGTIDGTVIGGSSAAAGTFTTFTSAGIDDNATSTAITIDSSENVGIGTASPSTFGTLAVTGSAAGAGILGMTSDATRVDIQAYNKPLSINRQGNNTLLNEGGGNVGIGTASPASTLHVHTPAGGPQIKITNTNTGQTSADGFHIGTDASGSAYLNQNEAEPMHFYTNASERMRIDASGNVLVGKTSDNITVVGCQLNATGAVLGTRASASAMSLNRTGTDGDIADFRKNGTTIGSIGSESGLYPYIGGNAGGSGDVFLIFISNTSQSIRPATSTGAGRDNAIDLGASSARFDDIYATNGTIQTSDANEKQDIEALSEAEQRVAVAAKALLRKFRWKSAVEEKGDDARIHFGIIAQDLQAAFEAEGLDAGRYAMFIHSTWWEHEVEVPAVVAQDAVYETQTDEEGNEMQVLVSEAVEGAEAYTRTDTYNTAEEAPEGAVERSRMGVRYSELLAFIIAAI